MRKPLGARISSAYKKAFDRHQQRINKSIEQYQRDIERIRSIDNKTGALIYKIKNRKGEI